MQESTTPSIVISASGMATGGRVLHHLARALPDARNTVLFAGYQAAGTRGRAAQGRRRSSRASTARTCRCARDIEAIDSMSAHADANEIMRWLGGFTRPPALTCLVHGEPGPDGHAQGAHRTRAGLDREDAGASGENRDSDGHAGTCSNRSTTPRSCSTTRTGSTSLPLDQKILTWHLYQAALAGRDIYYDQRYRHCARDARDPRGDPDASRAGIERRGRSPRFGATRSCSGSTPARTTA